MSVSESVSNCVGVYICKYVCVCVTLIVIINNNNPLHLQRVARRGQSKKEENLQPIKDIIKQYPPILT